MSGPVDKGQALRAARSSRDRHELFHLAGHASEEVRRAARGNQRLPIHLVRLHEALDDLDPQLLLLPDVLQRLGARGAHAQRRVALHLHTRPETLEALRGAGHGALLDRRAALTRAGAYTREAALALLVEQEAAPPTPRAPTLSPKPAPAPERTQGAGPADERAAARQIPSLRQRAQHLLKQVMGAGVPEKPPTSPVPSLRDRLRDPHSTFDEADVQAIKVAPANVQRLALRHPRVPWSLLAWLGEHGHEEAARQATLRRVRDPELPAALLVSLARHEDWEYREAVAGNPGLTLSLLRELARDPDWWVRATVAEHPAATPNLLCALAGEAHHVVIRENVAAHPHAGVETLRSLARDPEAGVRRAVAGNPGAPPDALAHLAGEPSARVREAVAAHPLTPPGVLRALEEDPNERVRGLALLRRPTTGEDALRVAHETRRRSVRLAVAAHPNAPGELLETLARDRSAQVRAAAGLHGRLSPAARAALAEDADVGVAGVARAANPGASPNELAALPRHDARVRLALAGNPRSPGALLAHLGADAVPPVREAVARNPATPEEGLITLVPDREVRPSLRQHRHYNGPVRSRLCEQELGEARGDDPALLAELGASEFEAVRRAVARNRHTPEPVLVALAGDRAVEVRQALLRRRDLPGGVQSALARDPELSLRQGLLRHEACAPATLLLLAADPSPDLRLMLARREETPAEVLEALAANPREGHPVLAAVCEHPRVTEGVLERMAGHPSLDVRRLVAGHPRVTPAVLLRLARAGEEGLAGVLLDHRATPAEALDVLLGRFPRLRGRVVEHPNTSGSTLERLADDPLYRAARLLLRRERFGPEERMWLGRLVYRRAGQDQRLLLAVARHPNATPRALGLAARGGDREIRAAIRLRSGREVARPEENRDVP